MKTSVNFITRPKEKSGRHKPAYVTRYGPKGFVIHGSRILGSLAVLPGLFLHWKVVNSRLGLIWDRGTSQRHMFDSS